MLKIGLFFHDNDKKFPSSFDTVFSSEGIEIVHTPFQAPRANAFAERWVRSVREECLDPILILNENYLRRVLKEYGEYYNHARPHQDIGQRFPVSVSRPERSTIGPIRRRDILWASSTTTTGILQLRSQGVLTFLQYTGK